MKTSARSLERAAALAIECSQLSRAGAPDAGVAQETALRLWFHQVWLAGAMTPIGSGMRWSERA